MDDPQNPAPPAASEDGVRVGAETTQVCPDAPEGGTNGQSDLPLQ